MSSIMDPYAPKSVSDLPAPFRSIFGFRYFNSLQSECFSACFQSDVNMVISAPTGSGKTVLFELCILRLLSRFISVEGRFIHLKGMLKTIYIAPSKALVQEKLRDWNQKLGSWGINCLELTGDNESYNIRNIQEADVIVTTPEKFDAVTRYRIKDGGLSFFSDIALVLIDEVHLLNEPRGAALEAIVCRIKMLSRNPEMKSSPLAHVRFVAVSATIPNIGDLAEWLMVPIQGIKKFGEEMRPVKLTTKVFGYTPAKNDFLFEKRLQNYIFDLLMQYSRAKSAMIFCSTRKGAQEAAQRLSQTAMTFGHSNPFIKDREQQERLREASLLCSDKQMQSYILYGVGYHNGGLCLKDRNLIEGLFLNGDLQVLCTTNTLAHGINLPAHTVVIKSTQHFNKEKGLYMEYDRSMILQMSGRAGRPPFDDTGMVIIMTRRETVHLYQNLLSGCEMVESQLLSCITEHLTAEVVQLTISDITRAIEWMKCSYLYVRMKKNPENYAIKKGIPSDRIEKHMQEICVQKVNELSSNQMIWTDEDGFLLKPLEPGRLMTKYYLRFDTMKNIMLAPADCGVEDALHVVCRAEEIAWIQLRRNEKKLLNDINTDKDGRLRFHILGDNKKRKKRIQTREEKIFLLANDCLTGDPSLHDLSMSQDMNSICSNGCRIAKCMKEYFIYKKNYKGALNSTLLAKSFHQKLWDDSPYLLKQLPGIGMVTAKALQSMGVKSFETLCEADPRKIEIITGRKYPFGNHIKESLRSLPPKIEMKLEETQCQRQGKSKLVVTLTRLSESAQSNKRHYADMVVALEEDNQILFHEKISRVDEFSSPYSATILVSSPQQEKMTAKADLIFEEFIGIDLHQKYILRKMTDSNMIHKHGIKHLSSFPQPKDVCIIEDDDKEYTSCAPTEVLHNSSKSKGKIDSMPSFNLLDEESEEEDGPSFETEDSECKIINQRTVFDHIREKAKSFPNLAASPNACPPSSETLLLIRKRTHEKHLEHNNAIEVLEETEGNKIPRSNLLIPSSEHREEHRDDIDKASTPNSPICFGELCLESKESTSKTLTEETIFEHIRKKAKNFSTVNKWKFLEPEPFITTKELFTKNQIESKNAAFDMLEPKLSDSEPMEKEGLQAIKYDLLSQSTRGTFGRSDQTSFKIPALSNQILDNEFSFEGPGISIESSGKQSCSPSLSRRQCCSKTTTSEIKEANSFLGFKSVFSFL
ncbi:DExH-box ATP-dependent RNA helicase DExH17 [Camellia lanceoleosa]|uniref:DExH-box ATP-dependent RNA helicase DExH17 n=1 Tax=Camellia lanceoleosa TaxID=1840588 RepID=A0ACC0I279_9ERIC|nr:DExH-box ATP-dependent RNA helicase DExH17 [Camellia lanceoleosa]